MPTACKGHKSLLKSSSACRGLLSTLPDLVASNTDHAHSEREPPISHDTYRRRRLTISPPRQYNNSNRLKSLNSTTKGHQSHHDHGRGNHTLNRHASKAGRSRKTSGAVPDRLILPRRLKTISKINGHLVKRGGDLANGTGEDVRRHHPSVTTTGTLSIPS